MKNILKILWKRHAVLILFVCGLLVFFGYSSGRDLLASWRTSYENATIYWQSENDPNFHLRDFISFFQYEQINEQFGEVTMETYLSFVRSLPAQPNPWEQSGFYDVLLTNWGGWSSWLSIFPRNLPMFLALFVGFFYFFSDMRTRFNQFLFSSQFSRKEIFWSKWLLILPCLLLSQLLAGIVRYSVFWLNIPREYMNIAFFDIFPSIAWSMLMFVFWFTIGAVFGMLSGQFATGILGLASFMIFLFMATNGIDALLRLIEVLNTGENTSTFILSNYLGWNTPIMATGSGHLISWFGHIAIIALVVLALSISYQKLSLEENGEFLLLPKMRKATFIFAIVGMAFISYTNSVQIWLSNDFPWTNAHILWSGVPNLIIGTTLMTIISYFIIYQRKGLAKLKLVKN